MSRAYGSPLDRGRSVDRALRRWSPGLTAGRSNAVARVRLGEGRSRGQTNADGPPGAPGPVGPPGDEDPLVRGHHAWWAAPNGPGTGSADRTQFAISLATIGYALDNGWAGPDSGGDLASVPYDAWESVSGFTDRDASAGIGAPLVQMGQGNGRGGFLVVGSFGFPAALPSATKSWFVGASQVQFGDITSTDATLSTQVNLIGVGGLPGAAPSFIHNDGSGTVTAVSTGEPDIGVDTVYEVRVFADPRRTDARIRFERFTHGRSYSVVDHVASSNLPVSLMFPMFMNIHNGATTSSVSIAIRQAFAAIQPIGMTIDS